MQLQNCRSIVAKRSPFAGAASSGKADPGNNDLPLVTLFKALSKDPGQITKWLGTAVPQQASYFLMYLFTKGIFARSIEFLRFPGLVMSFILGRVSTSERAKKRTWSRQCAHPWPLELCTICTAVMFIALQLVRVLKCRLSLL
jgi:hypothetical protein